MKSKLKPELGTRIMNGNLLLEALLVVSDRNRTETGLGKKKNVLEEY
jgi:hypothetical protein